MTRARPYDRNTALEAAMTLFWRKGYHATSLKDLEGALNMKPGSIYAAFRSKEALYLSALDRYFQETRESLRDKATLTGSPLAALADFMRGFGRPDSTAQGRHVCMVVKTMLDATDDEPAIAEAARAYLDRMLTEIAGLFQAARDMGELPPDADPSRLARRYQLNLTALRIEAQRVGADASLAALADDMACEVEALRVPPPGVEAQAAPTDPLT